MNNHTADSHSTPPENGVEIESALALLPLGELTAAEEATVRHHAATCERCQKRLAEYDEVYASLLRSLVGARSSQTRFTIDDIVLSADLSDSDDDESEPTPSISMPAHQVIPLTQRLQRRSRMLSGLGALAAMLLLALLAGVLFHLRGAPNSNTRVLAGVGTLTEYSVSSNGKRPGYLIAGPDGNIWFTENGAIGRITSEGKVTEFPLPGNANPSGIALGPDRSLLVIADNEILRVSMTGTVTRVPLPASVSRPLGSVATAPDGTIWFAEPGNPNAAAGSGGSPIIGRISSQGNVTMYDTSQSIPGNNIGLIGALPDGSLWIYTELGLGRMSSDGKITQVDSAILAHLVTAGAIDAEGNLWIVGGFYSGQGTGGKVVRFAPNGSTRVWSFSPNLGDNNGGIVATVLGPDGNLWRVGGGVILRTTLGGVVTAFQLPSDFAFDSLTVDTHGDLWFTETGTQKIGRIHISP